jgi:calcium/proton exchanger cax
MKGKLSKTKSFVHSCWEILSFSVINFLLVFVPAGIAVGQVPDAPSALIFTVNCVAVIPLACTLAFVTELVTSRMDDALGSLVGVTIGNAVELIIL